jgi:hypothetical protein
MNDDVLVTVFRRLVDAHGCSVDDILETPELRQAFLADTRLALGPLPERELLHRLVYLRKRGTLPRTRELV